MGRLYARDGDGVNPFSRNVNLEILIGSRDNPKWAIVRRLQGRLDAATAYENVRSCLKIAGKMGSWSSMRRRRDGEEALNLHSQV